MNGVTLLENELKALKTHYHVLCKQHKQLTGYSRQLDRLTEEYGLLHVMPCDVHSGEMWCGNPCQHKSVMEFKLQIPDSYHLE